MPRMRNDDGAAAVLIAVLMIVLMGFGALVVDVGAWYAEGRQLQNGAQAGAVAVAQGCVKDSSCDGSLGAGGRAGTYANLNANDNQATVTEVCGANLPSTLSPGLGTCSTPAQRDLYDCRAAPAGSTPYVQVRTQTWTTAGTNRVPPLLIRALQPTNTGKTVTACARAAWGGPAGLTASIPLTMSYCEFRHYVGEPAATFAPAPPPQPSPLVAPAAGWGHYAPAWEKTLFLKYSSTTPTPVMTACGSDSKNGPGAFGWLMAAACEVASNVDGTLPSDPGASPTNCSAAQLRSMVGRELSIPVYNEYIGGGTKSYVIEGYASFVMTGFHLSPGGSPGSYSQDSIVTGNQPCAKDPTHKEERCISGFFTKQLTPVSGAIGGPALGVTVMQVIG